VGGGRVGGRPEGGGRKGVSLPKGRTRGRRPRGRRPTPRLGRKSRKTITCPKCSTGNTTKPETSHNALQIVQITQAILNHPSGTDFEPLATSQTKYTGLQRTPKGNTNHNAINKFCQNPNRTTSLQHKHLT